MGIANVVNMCSHVTNASRARLGITSVPLTKYNLNVALVLHRMGWISFVTRGGTRPPDPATITTFEPEPLTTANVAKQRLWLGLKYNAGAGGRPVLGYMTPLTTPKKPLNLKLNKLQRLARGLDAQGYRGLNLGESIILTTDAGTLDIREAVERKVGGLLLCRIGP
ncbi:ribosomal protein S8 [Daldinia caldariorum]|uniref:ribosomal protein S8 n=1 Tax=Daldinia caldariorum TaxID=326644 RepID=UPI002007B08B|nr:ribosomal protein S8 [Daldinia caldariorum]KAI1463998.1 ribosomal protein S8 [Daldinia caldariorum]